MKDMDQPLCHLEKKKAIVHCKCPLYPLDVPSPHMYLPSLTCTLPSHVPSLHTYLPFTRTFPSHVPSPHMYPLLTCTLPLTHMYPPLTCTLPSHVPSPHMYPPLTCTLPSHVPSPHMYILTYLCIISGVRSASCLTISVEKALPLVTK